MTPRAGALMLAAATLLTGCAFEIPFDASWSLPLAAPPGAVAIELPMDLTDQDVWSRRDEVDEVEVEAVGVKIMAVGPRCRAQVAVLGLRYRPEGVEHSAESDVVVMEPVALPATVDAAVEVEAPQRLGEAVRDALRGSGRFTLLLEAEADGPVEVTLELTISGKALVAL